MYTPPNFAEPRPAALEALIRAHPLAAVVAATAGGLEANHIPLVLDGARGARGVLRGHVARANPMWRTVAERSEVLAIFQGPEHYVTPSWYASKREHGKVVPTWNYTVVHVRGRIAWHEEHDWLRGVLDELTSLHESARAEPWQISDAPADYVQRQLGAIVGFEIEIAAMTGKSKLSQNRSEADRAGVAAGLEAEGTDRAREVAEGVREAGVSEEAGRRSR